MASTDGLEAQEADELDARDDLIIAEVLSVDPSEVRDSLQGAEQKFRDLVIAEVLSSDQPDVLKAALERAARQGHRGLVQKLVEKGAEIGGALHAAAEGGHEDIVNDLLENGASIADINALNCLGHTPLYVAADGGHVAAALALMTAGADVNPQWSFFGSSVLQAAAERGDVGIMKAAIERGADVDVVDRRQRTPLHAAVSSNSSEAIDLLVAAGANIEAQDAVEGSTPLHSAARKIKLEAMLTLLKHGANVHARDMVFQDTPLHSAVFMAGLVTGVSDVVDSLLRSGADETTLNDNGTAAADLMVEVVEDLSLAEDLNRVRKLLARAPAERAWRRRGYLVLCRAHPDRMQQTQDTSTARTTSGEATVGRVGAKGCTGAVEASPMDGRSGEDWAAVVARVLRLQEGGTFRKIVGYL